eukprot:Selendium_serpulae@DN2106_c0_g1_i1.p1
MNANTAIINPEIIIPVFCPPILNERSISSRFHLKLKYATKIIIGGIIPMLPPADLTVPINSFALEDANAGINSSGTTTKNCIHAALVGEPCLFCLVIFSLNKPSGDSEKKA